MTELSFDEKKFIRKIPLEQLLDERIDIVSLDYVNKLANYKDEQIKKLNEQIEKMKCCGNCKRGYFLTSIHKEDSFCGECHNYDKWELAE